MTTILWFGRDLRLADNPALMAAIDKGEPIVPLYVLDDEDAANWAEGGASRWWLHGSLHALAGALEACGSRLVLRKGKAEVIMAGIVAETGATTLCWNRRYEPWALARNERLKKEFGAAGINCESFNASLMREPWSLKTQTGQPYRVFTPFWKALRERGPDQPLAAPPSRIKAPAKFPHSDKLEDWSLRPVKPDWAAGLRKAWTPGEAGGQKRLAAFIADDASRYADQRNFPGMNGTSRLSPHLHFGEIGPRQIWHALVAGSKANDGKLSDRGMDVFLSEIAWREFSYNLLFHFPHLPNKPLRAEFDDLPWINDPVQFRAWQRGQTGYPIVDAGMRELWKTGWMHNRVRMIVASFLIKDLLIDWQLGEAWFWDTLVDADLANNAASWQWVAGSGADAAPFFRIFNPSLQGAKFDPEGLYVRKWVPELAKLSNDTVHEPWRASPNDLSDAGVVLGNHYPHRIVDHAWARARALEVLKQRK